MLENTKDVKRKAIRNSSYNFFSTIIAKVLSLVLTIVLARILMPELFGVYSLVLSITLLIFTFTDLGINSASYRYLSDALKKRDVVMARSYFRYLLKVRGILVLLAIILMLVLSPVLAFVVYDKPIIFIPLLFATFYIAINSFRSVIEGLYFPTQDLKNYPITTAILHTLRVVLATSIILIISKEFAVSGVFVGFALASLISIFAILIFLGKRRELIIGRTKNFDKAKINSYLGFMSIAAVSLVIFGSVDTLMLGYFVDSEFIGFYRAALGLIVSIAAIFSLSNIFIPIFTRLGKDKLQEGTKLSSRYILIITVPAAIGLALIGKQAILIIYGVEYLKALLPLYILSALIVISPLIKVYSSIFESNEKTKQIARIVVSSLVINIVLNFVLISYFLRISQEMAIVGAAIATLVSQIFYLTFLSIQGKVTFDVNFPIGGFVKPLIGTGAMTLFLIYYLPLSESSVLYGISGIVLGIAIYFASILLIGGLKKEDMNLVTSSFLKKSN